MLEMQNRERCICANCHFLMQHGRDVGKMMVGHRNRELARRGNYSWVRDYVRLGCYLGVWDEDHPETLGKIEYHKTIVLKNRTDFCFFWEYRPGMYFPAGKRLQRRQEERRKLKRERRNTWIAIGLAFFGWLVNVGFAVGVFPL